MKRNKKLYIIISIVCILLLCAFVIIYKKITSSSIDNQINHFVENVDVWSDIDGYFCFTVADLNQDGRVELIVSTIQGSGSYSYTKYYEMEDNGTDIKHLQADEDSVGLIDDFLAGKQISDGTQRNVDNGISYVSVYHDRELEKYYYICYDYSGHTPYESFKTIYSLSLENDRIVENLLANKISKYEEPYGSIQSIEYWDSNNNQISEDAYNKIADEVYKNAEHMEMSWQWNRVETKEEIREMDKAELKELLMEAYYNFEIYMVE